MASPRVTGTVPVVSAHSFLASCVSACRCVSSCRVTWSGPPPSSSSSSVEWSWSLPRLFADDVDLSVSWLDSAARRRAWWHGYAPPPSTVRHNLHFHRVYWHGVYNSCDILEISWNLVDAPGKFIISNAIFAHHAIFTARCYASAVLAMGLCLSVSVCPSVRHKSEFY